MKWNGMTLGIITAKHKSHPYPYVRIRKILRVRAVRDVWRDGFFEVASLASTVHSICGSEILLHAYSHRQRIRRIRWPFLPTTCQCVVKVLAFMNSLFNYF